MSTAASPEPLPEPPAPGPRCPPQEDPELLRARSGDLRQDFNLMEQKKRVTMILQSPSFREELESLIQEQMKKGNNSSHVWALRQIADFMATTSPAALPTSPMGLASVTPINDLHGTEGPALAKGERLMRCKVGSIHRLLDLYGWAQLGHAAVTLRVSKEQEHFLVAPQGLACSEVTAASLVKVNVLGAVVEQGSTGFAPDARSFSLHAAIYAARPDTRCIVRLHTPAAAAVSAMRCGLLPISRAALLLGDVAYFDFRGEVEDEADRVELQKCLGPTYPGAAEPRRAGAGGHGRGGFLQHLPPAGGLRGAGVGAGERGGRGEPDRAGAGAAARPPRAERRAPRRQHLRAPAQEPPGRARVRGPHEDAGQPGLPHGLHVPLPPGAGEEQAQERRADPRHRHGLRLRGGARRDPRPAPARPEAAEGEDQVAQHPQHLHQGQPGRGGAGQRRQPEDKDHVAAGRRGGEGQQRDPDPHREPQPVRAALHGPAGGAGDAQQDPRAKPPGCEISRAPVAAAGQRHRRDQPQPLHREPPGGRGGQGGRGRGSPRARAPQPLQPAHGPGAGGVQAGGGEEEAAAGREGRSCRGERGSPPRATPSGAPGARGAHGG
ncbi:beta-adducin isoform X3 [Motacilla alba alba]|uniref:beta-adducin isoform X3 n=1 Tax=Motacilla alba alba TaxID=1094192 RepID=UPI0018D57938|nr:beta-adducin isoform X3 [Motacilla alba alba]